MEKSFFPVDLHDMSSAPDIKELKEMEFLIGKVQVRTQFVKHPGICVGYRLDTSNGSIAFLPDNEPYNPLKVTEMGLRAKLIEFLQNVDVLIMDAQYTDDEYAQKVNWGHGSLSSVVSLGLEAKARKLFLFHHDPNHDDSMVDEMVEGARMLVLESGKPMEVEAAREGSEVWLGAKAK